MQVDILGGTYCTACDETIVTNQDVFTLFAYGNTSGGKGQAVNPLGTYLLSLAVIPQSGTGADFGSFSVNGTAYSSANLVYGTPPVEMFGEMQGHDSGDLSPHSIYDTLFLELAFQWNVTQTRAGVNTQISAGTNPATNPGAGLYYLGWNIDISSMTEGFGLHFDLYDSTIRNCGKNLGSTLGGTLPANCKDIDRNTFAPFSHDGQTGISRVPVPEPGTLSLLGAALLISGFVGRRRNPPRSPDNDALKHDA